MTDIGDSSKSKQIRVLLGVLGAGLVAGVIIALSMLYYYNPTGSYLAKNVLLDPENAYSLRFIEPGPKGKSLGRYTFEGVYFSYFDPIQKITKSIAVPREKYAAFYQKIAHEESIVDPSYEIQSQFNQPHQGVLAVKVRSVGEDSSKGIEITFSEIDIVNAGDYYRIRLRQSGPGSEWAYFYHPGIYQEALNIFSTL